MAEGWAHDPDNPKLKITVNIYVNDTIAWTGLADQFRDDLLLAGLGDGRFAFYAKIQIPFKELGKTSVNVRANFSDTGRS